MKWKHVEHRKWIFVKRWMSYCGCVINVTLGAYIKYTSMTEKRLFEKNANGS